MSLRMLQKRWPSRSRCSRSISERRAQAADHGARQELVEALAHARAGWILGCGDAHMVAAVVLDEEVPVAGLGERHLGEPALGAGALVAELVRGVDRHAGDHRDRQREADRFEYRETAMRPHPTGEDQARVLQRQKQVGAPAVVAILLKPLDHAVGRVGGVQPDEQVEQWKHAEDEHGTVEPEHAETGRFDQPPGDERQQRHDQAEQPGVALAIAPAWTACTSCPGA